jgi:UrcA family protein
MNAATRYTLAALLVCSWSAGALAMGSADEIPQRTVHFADIDVSSGAGAAILYSRIKIVAAQVCEQINARSLPAVALAHRCMAQAISRAVADVNVPALSSYHLAQTGQSMIVARK